MDTPAVAMLITLPRAQLLTHWSLKDVSVGTFKPSTANLDIG
jgi:hypothetical protein